MLCWLSFDSLKMYERTVFQSNHKTIFLEISCNEHLHVPSSWKYDLILGSFMPLTLTFFYCSSTNFKRTWALKCQFFTRLLNTFQPKLFYFRTEIFLLLNVWFCLNPLSFRMLTRKDQSKPFSPWVFLRMVFSSLDQSLPESSTY